MKVIANNLNIFMKLIYSWNIPNRFESIKITVGNTFVNVKKSNCNSQNSIKITQNSEEVGIDSTSN